MSSFPVPNSKPIIKITKKSPYVNNQHISMNTQFISMDTHPPPTISWQNSLQ